MTKHARSLRVVGICGSLRPGSVTRAALAVALRGAEAADAETHLIDLRDYALVFCDGRDEDYPPDVLRLREDVKKADGIILATPEYHGGYSGVLKNALDLMGFEEFEGKMIGLVGVAGGRLGAAGALNSLREVGRTLHAWVVPEQASVSESWKAFDEAGRLTNPHLEKRLMSVGQDVAKFARLHAADKAAFVESFEAAPPNPGGENR